MKYDVPDEIERKLRRAQRLEWWSIFWLVTIIAVMYFAMGSSQAMKTAWIEDTLSLLPPILFLLARKFEEKEPTRKYPFGFHRGGSLGFFLAASSLAAMGGYLLFSSARSLMMQEHPTIGNVTLFGWDIWLGWVMVVALIYSVIPPVILGRMKKPLARATMDKILYTDADMNAADWKTGLAGIVGVIGVGFGFWWADAVAAGLISLDILRDGIRNLRISVAELLDGAPRKLDSAEVHPIVDEISDTLARRYPGHRARLRETGRFVRVDLVRHDEDATPPEAIDNWRVVEVTQELGDKDLS
ncbi:cation transporter [Thalassorhabdomicrobium marinisediminis]|uniref:Cobalt transporter n=1 Tax=Thalassorhabdomicrobium marinisediminis TaxID=2170577 RepID=A0A2T7FTM1_9RHOB|nr:cation transporter [Thalassorhabdomicrobium marinisediminis]PVA05519.1 cobalt transporter [Thalassorhabdomicrobium marinisediminis]